MSDKVKLIIEIPKEAKQAFDKAQSNDLKGGYYDHDGIIGKAIQNGIPLDDVKAEIEKKTDVERIKQNLSELAQYNADMLKAFNAGKELAEKEKREWIPDKRDLPEGEKGGNDDNT